MAKPSAQSVGTQAGMGELLARLRFLLLALIVYRIGTHIPVPGIDPAKLANMFSQNQGTILGLFNMFSGGALERMSIFALGIMPYISSSIIIQLLSSVSPQLEALKKEGESGRKRITQYTRYLTVLLALVQGSGMAVGALQGMAYAPGFAFYFVAVVSLVTGSLFLMWLGEQITERGIGNGISMLIFAGIVAGLPRAIGQSLEQARQGEMNWLVLAFIVLLAAAVIFLVVFIERGQRRITVNYAKQQRGNRVYQAQSSHLPLKVNMAGVIPAIFASSILLFPASIAQWFGKGSGKAEWLQDMAMAIGPGQPLNILLFAVLVVFFCFFYTALMFNPSEVAENLKKSGAFLPGIRPGQQTANYIDGVLTRLTVFGALYITLVCLLPQFLVVLWNVPFYLGGTSLLIVVVVVMDFMAQVQSHLMSHQYESLMKKANLKNYGRTGLTR
ncbi:MAG: protein translocase subunit secY/sec61 alpha [Verrucomicrobiaceae bacterium]|nr:protein translocase subunit secY/sec61 alpha [Verrucomicrobiaceae bacterium]